MQIGLIGGIGPAATDFYYRRIIRAFAERGTDLDMTIVHADSPTLIRNLGANDVDAQVAIYRRLTDRLVDAGAGCVVVTSIAGHFCIDAFKAVSSLPTVDMIQEVAKAIASQSIARVGILGTKTVMENKFYGGIETADVMPPDGGDLDAVHQAYVDMATVGQVTDAQRDVFYTVGQKLIDAGAEAVMLGGTDLALAFDPESSPFPIVDCAGIHADAVVEWAAGAN